VAGTPAITTVEREGITYSLHEYEHDPAARSFGDEAVEKLGWDATRVFKTLVVSVDGELHVACLPVSAQLDLKALGKRSRLADKDEAHRATGYVFGGTSPSACGSGSRPTWTRRRSATRRSSSTAAGAACSSSSTRTTSCGSRLRASTR
jgi:Cys-tRNA(Pro) deacylase